MKRYLPYADENLLNGQIDLQQMKQQTRLPMDTMALEPHLPYFDKRLWNVDDAQIQQPKDGQSNGLTDVDAYRMLLEKGTAGPVAETDKMGYTENKKRQFPPMLRGSRGLLRARGTS